MADETAGCERHAVTAKIEPRLDVAPANRERAVRLISALAFELEGRGHTIQRPSPDTSELIVTVGIQTISCTCTEAMQLDDEYSRVRGTNQLKSHRNGNLQLILSGGRGGLRNTWADRPRGQAIGKVGKLVDELELRSRLEIASRDAPAELREMQDRTHAAALVEWAHTLSVARHEHVEGERRAAALEQAARADQAASLRRLSEAVTRNAHTGADIAQAERNLQWAADVARYADEIDPAIGEATPLIADTPWIDLASFLHGRTPPAHPSTIRPLWGTDL